ncbi:MAG TPA: SCO family protein [Acidimicrobiales bacterium]|jgi:cytochrome oxidase Cu insertion factor (SCO1/SenC/PrrC family)|nr:SCO family protein [Acidimicrobiales bacterium]
MSTGLPANNSTVVHDFQSALVHQALVVVAILMLLAVAWNLLRAAELRRGMAAAGASAGSPGDLAARTSQAVPAPAPASVAVMPEPLVRRLLRIGFGLLWVLDGLLQAQASMPLGMTTQVISPAASTSPSWVQHLVNVGGTIWNDHPVVAATAAVWIQFGIGVWILVAPRGNWSRASGAVSAVWALAVWVFGEAFGGLFAPGLSFLDGAPGAVVIYLFAGILIALPEGYFTSGRIAVVVSRVLGAFFVAMGVLQAWPGRGYWQGKLPAHAGLGSLASMVSEMAKTPQPRATGSAVSAFASLDAAHGFAVNLVVVVALLALGAALLTADRRVLRYSVPLTIVMCLAIWVLVQDVGFFGGTGTDPNSMIPLGVMLVASYLGIRQTSSMAEPAAVLAPPARLAMEAQPLQDAGTAADTEAQPGRRTWPERLASRPAYALRVLAAGGAVIIVLLGAAPMALASLNRTADTTLALAIDGTPAPRYGVPAPKFSLTDQFGKQVNLASLSDKVVVLTFLDPVCSTDCPEIAQEMRLSDQLVGSEASGVEFVAVVANPLYRSVAVVDAFDATERLNSLPNWLYLTGSLSQLEKVWSDYYVGVSVTSAGGMVAHDDLAYVIDRGGREQWLINSDPGPGTEPTEASFAGLLHGLVVRALR